MTLKTTAGVGSDDQRAALHALRGELREIPLDDCQPGAKLRGELVWTSQVRDHVDGGLEETSQDVTAEPSGGSDQENSLWLHRPLLSVMASLYPSVMLARSGADLEAPESLLVSTPFARSSFCALITHAL